MPWKSHNSFVGTHVCAALCVEPPAHLSKSAVPLKGTAPEKQGFACSCRFRNGGWFWELQRNLLSSVNDIRDDDASHSTDLWDLCAQPLSPNILTECSWFTFSKPLGTFNLFYSSLARHCCLRVSFDLVSGASSLSAVPGPDPRKQRHHKPKGKPHERRNMENTRH